MTKQSLTTLILLGDSNGLGDAVCDLAEICFRHGFQFVQFVRFNPTISIHALREESDGEVELGPVGVAYFNPRSP